ncbi:MAG: methyltransferase domain-containing protein [Desulfobulbaceae bacterium]|nr:methyltransferase domain-containing protein [Desulfobulbaceae bacterium]HIJ91006.1 class I SAM-dependent methyltransferase [Deltaproteobacteria bacterium]
MEKETFWRQAARVFDERAGEYDAWFEESLLFAIERAALQELVTPLLSPKLEIGVGPGRFAEALGVEFGIDPALAPLAFAGKRGVRVGQAVGEALPFTGQSMQTVLLLFTFCFLADPRPVLQECRRVLKPGGHLVLGIIAADSSWGRMLRKKKEAGHPFYRHAGFYRPEEVEQYLVGSGFVVEEIRSSLMQPPESLREMEHSRAGLVSQAGFVVLVAGPVP